MIPILPRAEAIGLCQSLRSPPIGTPSRILSARLKRASGSHQVRHASSRPVEETRASSSHQPRDAWGSGLFPRRGHNQPLGYDLNHDGVARPAPLPSFDEFKPPQYPRSSRDATAPMETATALRDGQPQLDDSLSELDQSQLSWSWPVASVSPQQLGTTPPGQIVERLLQAVQAGNAVDTFNVVAALTALPDDGEVGYALGAIPRTTITSIFELLDPFRSGQRLDCTHGLTIPERLQEYSPVALAFDDLGIRNIYKTLFQVLMAFAKRLDFEGVELLPSDYIVLLRCAGATSDIAAAKAVWKIMDDLGTMDMRATRLYDEFFKARFLTERLYTQNDYSRLRFRARDISGWRKTNPITSGLKGRLDRIRLYRARAKYSLYGQAPGAPTKDLHWTLSLPAPLKRITRSMQKQGVIPDAKLMCSLIVANSRSGNVHQLHRFLQSWFGITLSDPRDPRRTEISLEQDRRDLRRPSDQVIGAMVRALGYTGQVILARRLLQFMSRHLGVTVDPQVWSELLSYTYIFSTHRARVEWGMFESHMVRSRDINAKDVLSLWDTMVSEPFNVQPCFEDLDRYVKALIQAGKIDTAKEGMRVGVAHYRKLTDNVQEALFETLYPSPPPSAKDRFLKAKARQHTAWYAIMRWCDIWVRKCTMSKDGTVSDAKLDEMTARTIPDLVLEFRQFMPEPVVYRTTAGLVRLSPSDGDKSPMFGYETHLVSSMPTETRRRVDLSLVKRDPKTDQPLIGESGHVVYDRHREIFQQTFTRGIRVRREQAWEAEGPWKTCVREMADARGVKDGEMRLVLKHAELVKCVEW